MTTIRTANSVVAHRTEVVVTIVQPEIMGMVAATINADGVVQQALAQVAITALTKYTKSRLGFSTENYCTNIANTQRYTWA